MKKTYVVSSYHNVYENSYTDGEQDWVNEFEIEMKVFDAKDPIEAVAIFYDKQLGREFDASMVDVEDGGIYDSFLVDEENLQATESEIERWKKGEKRLYENNFRVVVQELEILDLEKYFFK